ncbi:MAG: hypothetical protein WAK48_00665 [Candidatus Acidiferrum sp.]|jgi:hypothetical protein
MTDEVRRKDGILNESSIFTKDNSDRELSTADLAGTQDLKHGDDAVIEREPNKTQARVVATGAAAGVASAREQESTPLFPSSEANDLRGRWDAVQVGFVDEPRGAVEQADNLVASTMKRLAEIFAEERGRLESQWDQGENVSTEDLRLALRRYRSFFSRLLSV